MWFSLFAAVLVVAVMFYQGLLGLFSGVINCILTILAAALAFGLYEDFYYGGPYPLIANQPDDGRGIALVAVFIVSLLILRVIMDLLIKDNMRFSVYVDRIGGGAFGLVTALIIIGVLCTGIQMLPFPFQWLGFSRYVMYNESGAEVSLTSTEEKRTERDILAQLDLSAVHFKPRKLWFNPDGFAINVASYLSDNALAGSSRLSQAHPELLDEEYWARFTTVGQNTSVARKPDAIRIETMQVGDKQVQACWKLRGDKDLLVLKKASGQQAKGALVAPDDKHKTPSGYQLVAVRVTLTSDASDDGTGYRFTTNQVRLVTTGKGGHPVSYGLAGINATPENLPAASSKDYLYRLNEGETVTRTGGKFNFVFEIPDDAEPPWCIVFRRNARAEIRAVQDKPPKSGLFASDGGSKKPGKETKASGGDNSGGPDDGGDNSGSKKHVIQKHSGTDASAEARGGGRTRRYTSDEEGSFFGPDMPVYLTDYHTDSCEVQGEKVIGGMGFLTAKLDKDDNPLKGDKPTATTFVVPEGKQLLQLSVRRLHPGSLYGQVMDFARQLANVGVKDDKGHEYPAIGTWGIASVGNDRVFELVYYDELAQTGRSNPPKLNRILSGNMSTDYALYYLFQVPPGTHIVRFTMPKSDGEDLTKQNLVAPGKK